VVDAAAEPDQFQEFTNSLTQFGFDQATRTAIVVNGLHATHDPIGLIDKDIDNIMKIMRASTLPPMIVSCMA
jgi:hypothetical protein